MATELIITKEYSAPVSREYYTEIIATAETLRQKAARMLGGVKDELRIPNFAINPGLARKEDCSSTPQGSYAMDNKLIEVCTLKTHNELCHADFQHIYNDKTPYEYTTPGSMVKNIPELQNRIFMNLLRLAIARDIEKIMWSGDNDNGGYEAPDNVATLCDGWLKRYNDAGAPNSFGPVATSDPDAVGNVGDDNLIEILSRLVKKMDNLVYQNVDISDQLIIYASAAFMNFVDAAVTKYNANYADGCPLKPTSDRRVWRFNSIPILFTSGIDGGGNGPGSATIILTFRDNLWLGYDLESDMSNFRIVNNAQTFAAKFTTEYYGEFKIGTQIRNENYISAYISQ